MTHSDNPVREIKHRMYALRNGAVADAMRRMGAPYRIIFGVNLPQLAAIAAETEKSASLARDMWLNTSTRESMLLAPMLFPPEEFDIAQAHEWAAAIPTAEVADVLCMKLLKKMPWARKLALELTASESDMTRYTGFRLLFNLLPAELESTRALAEAELSRGEPLTAGIARSLIDEIDFLSEK